MWAVGPGNDAEYLPVPGRSTTLAFSRAGACFNCSRCGSGGLFLYTHGPRPAAGIEHSGCPSVRISISPSEDQGKIFVQGRISRSIKGSQLLVHVSMYLYDTSRNIKELRHHDLYFTVH